MNLKCNINGKVFNIVKSPVFSDEFNETLDSGTIILSHIDEKIEIKPFDDVFIYDNEFNGYFYNPYKIKKIVFDNQENIENNWIKKDENYSYIYILKKDLFYYINNKDNIKLGEEIKIELLELETDKKYNIDFAIELNDNEMSLVPKSEQWKNIVNPFVFFEETKGEEIYYVYKGDLKKSEFIPLSIINFDVYYKYIEKKSKNKFYKHLLVDEFSKEIINLDNKKSTYKIRLFSETKGLEKIQLPNISITQPLKFEKKKSVWYYLNQFVEMYSPKIKMIDNMFSKTWKYVNKYTISYDLKEIFENVYAPDFSLNNPNLRDVISRLMLVKDMIPYVKDGVICAMDITKRGKEFTYDNKKMNYLSLNLSSSNYCDNLKRTYSDALSQENTCRRTEYLSFRNSNSSLMTIENMRLETNFPIYKINQVIMCYYKKVMVYYQHGGRAERYLLCKQDITPLVKLSYESEYLEQDWNKLLEIPKSELTVEKLSKFKVGVVNYNIGSKFIDGWGKRYTYIPNAESTLTSWWTKDATYLENILKVLKYSSPLGIESYDYLIENSEDGVLKIESYTPTEEYEGETYSKERDDTDLSDIPYFFDNNKWNEGLINPLFTKGLKLKTFFFIVDYNAFYNGTIIHSKDKGLDNIVANDNASSSLTLLEFDGLHQKEKINRYGNPALVITARYNSFDEMCNLGDVYFDDENDDIIIYHREYSVDNNFIVCKYYGMKDYVLKNYFTSVFAKHRTYNLMSYNESTRRSENKKNYLLLSKEYSYFEKKDQNNIRMFNFEEDKIISKLLSFMKSSKIDKTRNKIVYDDKINSGYIQHYNPDLEKMMQYLCDVNAFVSGYSICFNLSMFDNVSSGVYIEKRNPDFDLIEFKAEDLKGDYSGSRQKYYLVVDDEETGFTDILGFYVSHINSEDLLLINESSLTDDEKLIKNQYEAFDKMPLITNEKIIRTNVIGNDFKINKDNKELIDMTFQIEPITVDKDIFFNQWMMKLSDLLSSYNKFYEPVTFIQNKTYGKKARISPGFTIKPEFVDEGNLKRNFVVLKFKKGEINEIYETMGSSPIKLLDCYAIWDDYPLIHLTYNAVTYLRINIESISIRKLEGKFNLYVNSYTQKTEVAKTMFNKRKEYFDSFNFDSSPDKGRYVFKNVEDVSLDNNSIIDNLTFEDQPNYEQYDYYVLEIDEVVYNNNEVVPAENIVATSSSNTIYYYSTHDKVGGIFFERDFYFKDAEYYKENSFEKNMYITLNKEYLKKEIVYNEKQLDEIIDSRLNPQNIFKVEDNILKVDLSKVPNDTKSIQQWFLINGSLKFVFGVNLTSQDFSKGYINIYLSLIQNRDTRIYDEMHNIAGAVTNYKYSSKIWGDKQYYDNVFYKITYKYKQYLGIINGNPIYKEIKKPDYIELAENTKILPSILDAPKIDGYTVTAVSPLKEIIVNSDITITYTYI